MTLTDLFKRKQCNEGGSKHVFGEWEQEIEGQIVEPITKNVVGFYYVQKNNL